MGINENEDLTVCPMQGKDLLSSEIEIGIKRDEEKSRMCLYPQT
jgi:hypothetical protein